MGSNFFRVKEYFKHLQLLSSCLISLLPLPKAERDRLEREKQARQEAEQRQLELETRLRELEEEARHAIEAQAETQRMVDLLHEKVCLHTRSLSCTHH